MMVCKECEIALIDLSKYYDNHVFYCPNCRTRYYKSKKISVWEAARKGLDLEVVNEVAQLGAKISL